MLTLARRSPAQILGQSIIAHRQADAHHSFLGPRTEIEGILEIDGELVISGRVKGQIAAFGLVIAKGGHVEGDVIAREVVISGHMNGRVFAPTVSIEAGAKVEGRVFHTHVTVARGAHVIGRMPWRPLSYFETLEKLPEIRP